MRSIGVGDWNIALTNQSSPVANAVETKGWEVSVGGNVKPAANASTGTYDIRVWEQNNFLPPGYPVGVPTPSGALGFRVALYRVQVVALTLKANTQEISKKIDGTQTSANLMVGQSVSLSATISPTLTMTNPTWTVGGEKIKRFDITPWTDDNPNTPTINEEVKPSGKKVEMGALDWEPNPNANPPRPNPSFYFTKGSFSGEEVQVTFTATVNGKSVSNTGKIKVKSPEMAAVTAADTDPFLSYGPEFGPLKGQWTNLNPPWGIINGYLKLGNNDTWAHSGLHWSGGVNVPTDVSGEIAFIQRVATQRSVTTGITQSVNSGGSYILDTIDGTVPLSGKTVSVSSTKPNANYIWKTDSPANPVSGTTSTSLSDSFQTYFVFRPIGGIWVTLGVMNWSISASSNSVPAVNPGFLPATGGTTITGSASSTLPEWGDSTQAISARNGF